jgi:hypothetical protein
MRCRRPLLVLVLALVLVLVLVLVLRLSLAPRYPASSIRYYNLPKKQPTSIRKAGNGNGDRSRQKEGGEEEKWRKNES